MSQKYIPFLLFIFIIYTGCIRINAQGLISGSNIYASANFIVPGDNTFLYVAGEYLTYEVLSADAPSLTSYTLTINDSIAIADSCGYTHYSNNFFVSRVSTSGVVDWIKISSVCDTLKNFSVVRMVTDVNYNVYLLGIYKNVIDLGNQSLTTNAEWDIFLYKISPQGQILWSKSGFAVGSTSAVKPTDMYIESQKVYISGNYKGTFAFVDDTLISSQNQFFVVSLSENGEDLAFSAGLGVSPLSNSNLQAISNTSYSSIVGILQAQDSVMYVSKNKGQNRDTISIIRAFDFYYGYVVDTNNVISKLDIIDTVCFPLLTDTLFVVPYVNIINPAAIYDSIQYADPTNREHTYICEFSNDSLLLHNEFSHAPHTFFVDALHGDRMYGLYNYSESLDFSNQTLLPNAYQSFAVVEYDKGNNGIVWSKVGYSNTDTVQAANFCVIDTTIYIAGSIGKQAGNHQFYFNNQVFTASTNEDCFIIKHANNNTEWVQIFGDASVARIRDLFVRNEYSISAVGSYTSKLTYNNATIETSAIQDLFIVDVDPFPQFDVLAYSSTNLSVPLCEGDSVLLVVQSQHTSTFQWVQNGVAIPNANNDSLWVYDSGTYLVKAYSNTIQYPNASPYIKTSQIFDIVFHQYPNNVVVASNSTLFCKGQSTLLSIDILPTDTCVWYCQQIGYIDSIRVISVSESGTYYASIQNSFGCMLYTDSIYIQVIEPPIDSIAILENTHLFCSGDSVTIKCFDTGNNTFTWYKNNDPIYQSTQPYIRVREQGSYSVTIVNDHQCLTHVGAIELVEISPPVLQTWFSAHNSGICEGETAQIQLSSHSLTEYTWFFNNDSLHKSTQSIDVSEPGLYHAIAVTAGVCYTYSDTIQVNVHQFPQIVLQLNTDSIICKFQTAELQIQSNQIVEYSWLYNNQIITNEQTAFLFASQAGIYKAIATNEFGCSVQTNPQTISVKNSPELEIRSEANRVIFCEGDSLRLFVHNPLSYVYEWRLNNTPLFIDTTVMYAKQSGAYSVYITDTVFNCSSATNTLDITAHSVINKTIQYNNSTLLCEQDTMLLHATTNATQYAWFYNNSVMPSHTSSTIAAVRSGMYYAIITDEFLCSAKTNEVSLVFLDNQIPPIQQDKEFLSTRLYANLTWYRNNEPIENAHEQVYLIRQSGKYFARVTHESGCISQSATIEACVPFPHISKNQNQLQASLGDSYQWFFEQDTIFGATESHYFAQLTGYYSVAVTLPDNCVSRSEPIQICYPVPTIEIEPNNVLRSTLGLEYQWYNNNTPITDADARLYVYTTPGIYYVEVVDIEGCLSYSDPIVISTTALLFFEQNEYTVYPNPFTQKFVVHMPYTNQLVTLHVYNAAGQEVLQKSMYGITNEVYADFLPVGTYTAVLQSKHGIKTFVLQKL